MGCLAKHGVGAEGLQLHLFEALVKPVMDFGAAVWRPTVAQAGTVKEAEDLCLQTLRLTFRVKSSAVGVVLLREVGWAPVWATWVLLGCRAILEKSGKEGARGPGTSSPGGELRDSSSRRVRGWPDKQVLGRPYGRCCS